MFFNPTITEEELLAYFSVAPKWNSTLPCYALFYRPCDWYQRYTKVLLHPNEKRVLGLFEERCREDDHEVSSFRKLFPCTPNRDLMLKFADSKYESTLIDFGFELASLIEEGLYLDRFIPCRDDSDHCVLCRGTGYVVNSWKRAFDLLRAYKRLNPLPKTEGPPIQKEDTPVFALIADSFTGGYLTENPHYFTDAFLICHVEDKDITPFSNISECFAEERKSRRESLDKQNREMRREREEQRLRELTDQWDPFFNSL